LTEDDQPQLPELDIQPPFEPSLFDGSTFHLLNAKDSCGSFALRPFPATTFPGAEYPKTLLSRRVSYLGIGQVLAAAHAECRCEKRLLRDINANTTVDVSTNEVIGDIIKSEIQQPGSNQDKHERLLYGHLSYGKNARRVSSPKAFPNGQPSSKNPRSFVLTKTLSSKRWSVRKGAKTSRFASFFQSEAYKRAEHIDPSMHSCVAVQKSPSTLTIRQGVPEGGKASPFARFSECNEYKAGAHTNSTKEPGISCFDNTYAQTYGAEHFLTTNQVPPRTGQRASKWTGSSAEDADEGNLRRHFFHSSELTLHDAKNGKEGCSISSRPVSCSTAICRTPHRGKITNNEFQCIGNLGADEHGREAVDGETDAKAAIGDLPHNPQSENGRVAFLVEALLGGRRLQQLRGTAEYGFTREEDHDSGIRLNMNAREEGLFRQPRTPVDKIVPELSSYQVTSCAPERVTKLRQPTPNLDRNKDCELQACSTSDKVKNFENEHVVFDQPWSPRRLKYEKFSPIPFSFALKTNCLTPKVSEDDGEFPLSGLCPDLTDIDDTIRFSPSFNNGWNPYMRSFCRTAKPNMTDEPLLEHRARQLLQKDAVRLEDHSVSQTSADAPREGIASSTDPDGSLGSSTQRYDHWNVLNIEENRMITLAILEGRWSPARTSSPPIVRAVVSHYPGDVDVEWLQPIMNQPKVRRPIHVQPAIIKWQEEALAHETLLQGSMEPSSHQLSQLNAPRRLPAARAACIPETKAMYPMSMEELMMRTDESLVFPAADRPLLDDEKFGERYF